MRSSAFLRYSENLDQSLGQTTAGSVSRLGLNNVKRRARVKTAGCQLKYLVPRGSEDVDCSFAGSGNGYSQESGTRSTSQANVRCRRR